MNNLDISTTPPDATSMAIVESGHDLGMRCKYGDEELEDTNYLQRNSTTIQESSNTVSNRLQWQPESNKSTDIKTSHLDDHSSTSPQQTSNNSERVMEDQSKNRKRLTSLPERSEWNNKSKSTTMGIRELCENYSLDLPSKAGTQYSDRYAHNKCANETNNSTLSELSNLPDYICEHLGKNNQFGFHKITNDDSFDVIGDEFIEYLNEQFGLTDIKPVFMDRSGFVIWLLDKDGDMYQWNEMEINLLYMGKNLVDGLTNYFMHPENICQVMNNGDRIPIMEFKRLVDEGML
ncbi:1992_t:CDS:2 [Paraglomus occultum]|uniref:1992_t:CDS:1 n=1 Tax=Paraglomus occultum TaxID=144539 RepID=A0A9N9GWM2_9GLOM|nr:1992_t:CDS:2 [Paraglomus occultum]